VIRLRLTSAAAALWRDESARQERET